MYDPREDAHNGDIEPPPDLIPPITYGCDYCPATITRVEHEEGGLCEPCRTRGGLSTHDLFNELHRRLYDEGFRAQAADLDDLHHQYTDRTDNQ